MARTMRHDNADIYRMVVDVHRIGDHYEGGFHQYRTVYGPYDTPSMAKDYSDRFEADSPKRLTKQILGFDGGGNLVWISFPLMYRNGGEGVNWSDEL